MKPLVGAELEQRIAELEQLRDAELAATEYVKTGSRNNTHATIRRRYNVKITNLRKYGVEAALHRKEVVDKGKATKYARYGTLAVNFEKAQATKFARYGNGFGDIEKRNAHNIAKYGNKRGNLKKGIETKRAKYGNGLGDMTKLKQTKLERYGDPYYSNYEQARQTKLQRWGNAGPGNIDKARQTRIARYGNPSTNLDALRATTLSRHGVVWPCQLPQCRAKSKAKSAHNTKICTRLNMLFDNINVHFEQEFTFENTSLSYDIVCKSHKLLIELNPTISHNSTRSFANIVYNSKHNWQRPYDDHFNKTQLALKHGYACITMFDWVPFDVVIDVIRKHLAGEPVNSTDFALNPQLSDDKSTIRKHWCHLKTKEHIEDCRQDEQEMIDAGYVAVYDCGHAKS